METCRLKNLDCADCARKIEDGLKGQAFVRSVSVDFATLSHDHYDHLDYPTIRALARHSAVPFVTSLGVGAHLQAWGVAPERIAPQSLPAQCHTSWCVAAECRRAGKRRGLRGARNHNTLAVNMTRQETDAGESLYTAAIEMDVNDVSLFVRLRF